MRIGRAEQVLIDKLVDRPGNSCFGAGLLCFLLGAGRLLFRPLGLSVSSRLLLSISAINACRCIEDDPPCLSWSISLFNRMRSGCSALY